MSGFISGVNLDEDAQNIVDKAKETSENINENNNSSFNIMDEQVGGDPLQRSGQTLPTNEITPLKEIEEMDYGDLEEIEEDDAPIVNADDNISTNNPKPLACGKKTIINAYFAKKTKIYQKDGVKSYTFNSNNKVTSKNQENLIKTYIIPKLKKNENIRIPLMDDIKTKFQVGKTYKGGSSIVLNMYVLADKYIKVTQPRFLGTKIFLIAETKNFNDNEIISFSIYEKEPLLVENDKPLPILNNSIEQKHINANVKFDKVTGKYLAIKEISLRPEKDEEFESWKKKFEQEAQSKEIKTYLWLKVSPPGVPYIGNFEEKYFLKEDGLEIKKQQCSIGKDGFLLNFCTNDFTKKHIKKAEHGTLRKINAIVIHRTAGSNLSFGNAKNNGIAAHFYIDKSGKIYQIASLNQVCYHVGKIKSRAVSEKTQTKADKAYFKKIGWSPSLEYKYETKKNYPVRYPYNYDSIGIETVGAYNVKTKVWDTVTDAQKDSVSKLYNCLVKLLQLDKKADTYVHEQISRKTKGEGQVVLDAIQNLI